MKINFLTRSLPLLGPAGSNRRPLLGLVNDNCAAVRKRTGIHDCPFGNTFSPLSFVRHLTEFSIRAQGNDAFLAPARRIPFLISAILLSTACPVKITAFHLLDRNLFWCTDSTDFHAKHCLFGEINIVPHKIHNSVAKHPLCYAIVVCT